MAWCSSTVASTTAAAAAARLRAISPWSTPPVLLKNFVSSLTQQASVALYLTASGVVVGRMNVGTLLAREVNAIATDACYACA